MEKTKQICLKIENATKQEGSTSQSKALEMNME